MVLTVKLQSRVMSCCKGTARERERERVSHREGTGLGLLGLGLQHKALHVGQLLNALLYHVQLHLCSLHLQNTDTLSLPALNTMSLGCVLCSAITCRAAKLAEEEGETLPGSWRLQGH